MTNSAQRALSVSKAVSRSWVTWLVLGGAFGTFMLVGRGQEAQAVDGVEQPSGGDIDNAVARAEAEANSAGTGQ